MIARQDGKPVGLALFFFEFSTWRGRPGVYVQDLYVAADMRGTGLGRRLLEAVAARAARTRTPSICGSPSMPETTKARAFTNASASRRRTNRLWFWKATTSPR